MALKIDAKDARSERRKRGSVELEFWAASLLARRSKTAMFAVPSASEIDAQVQEDIEFAKHRGQRDPTRIPHEQMRFLKVESAFTAMAARSAKEVYGDWSQLDDEGKKNWERFLLLSRQRIRGVCHMVLVDKKPASAWRDEQTFGPMALYGVDRYSFAKWLGYKLDDVREFLGR